ncbi:MAG: thiol:disulfide interchange protein [Massilia sp.]|nr:thiol:disulfide interchange protein [Massilia sp.]
MQWKQAFAAMAGLFLSTQLWAETPKEASIRKMIEPRMGEHIKVDSVTKTPYGDMYEVRTNGDIFYTDETARYLFVGKVMDLTTLQDLTRARVDQISSIKFSELPLGDAIKTVKGNGKRVMAVFEDPNCPYCKKLHVTLKGIDNVTVYTFLLNILSDDSVVKAKNIWCAPDRALAWQRWIEDNQAAPVAPASCATPHEKIIALGHKLRIVGTPTIYFADGSRAGSGFDVAAIEAKLNVAK